MKIEQAKTKKLSKNEQRLHNAAIVAAVITNTFFSFILVNRKNSFSTYDFIAEMATSFLGHCDNHKYVLGKDTLNDRDGIINWCRDVLAEHPDFKDKN